MGAADVHSPFLTVEETLVFAGACLLPIPTPAYLASPHFKRLFGSSAGLSYSLVSQLLFHAASCPSSLRSSQHHLLRHPSFRRAFAAHRTDLVISLLSLSTCRHVRVGNLPTSGITAEERRRLSIGEALMGDYSVICFDEVREKMYRGIKI